MPSVLFGRGRRLYSTASILILLTAAAHTAGNVAPLPTNDDMQQVLAAMKAYRQPMGFGMSPSMLEMHGALSWTMSLTFAALGVLGLVLAGSADVSIAVLRRVGWLNAAWVATAGVIYAVHQVPPPLICTLLIELVLLLWLFLPARRST